MRLSRTGYPVLVASCLVLLVASACGSSSGSNVDDAGTAANAATGRAGTANATGGRDGLQLGTGGTSASGGMGSTGEACAGELIEAQRIPLDMYVMLDVSGSMLAPTAGDANVTKWQAVSTALTGFVSDDASAGIGVGLQVFPIANAGAPTSCTTDQQCASFGPCLNRACWPLIGGVVTGCLDDNGCTKDHTCIVMGECSNDDQFVCNRDATAVCGANRGNCVVPPSICVSAADCRTATYATPAAEIAELPGAEAALVGAITAAEPDEGGLTPTGPAIAGAIAQVKAWAEAHPDRQVVAVLATDGLPTLQAKGQLCEMVTAIEDIDAVVNLTGQGRTGAPSVSTFVIGVVGADDAGATEILDAIATAGGTNEAFIVDTQGDVQLQFQDALNQIRASGLSCELAVPQSEAGKVVDYDKVNVDFTGEDGVVDELLNVTDAGGCGRGDGWYYNVSDTSKETPTRIEVCPTTCAKFQATDVGSVKIVLNCATRKPK